MGPSPGNGETRDLWYISCTACQCEMSHGSGALVIGQWNRRAPTGVAPAQPSVALSALWEALDGNGETTVEGALQCVRIHREAFDAAPTEAAPKGQP